MTNVKSTRTPPLSAGTQGLGFSQKRLVRAGRAEMISHQALVIDDSESEHCELMWRTQTLPYRRNHSSSTLLSHRPRHMLTLPSLILSCGGPRSRSPSRCACSSPVIVRKYQPLIKRSRGNTCNLHNRMWINARYFELNMSQITGVHQGACLTPFLFCPYHKAETLFLPPLIQKNDPLLLQPIYVISFFLQLTPLPPILLEIFFFSFPDELPSHDCLHPALRRLGLITSREERRSIWIAVIIARTGGQRGIDGRRGRKRRWEVEMDKIYIHSLRRGCDNHRGQAPLYKAV